MELVTTLKRPVKRIFTAFPLLDCFCRRFVWKHVYQRLYFHEAEMAFVHALPVGSIDIAVDAGAAMGSYSWILDRVAHTVVAFEPGAIHNRCLRRMSFFTNIQVVRAALGAVCGDVRFFTPGDDSTSFYAATASSSNPVSGDTNTHSELVPQTTLDAHFSNVPRDRRIDFLKIDVEGYELEVLRGALQVLKKFHPLVICEIEARHNPQYPEVFVLLRSLGYRAYILRDGAFEPFDDDRISHLQLPRDLEARLHGGPPERNLYINNFVFQHAASRVNIAS